MECPARYDVVSLAVRAWKHGNISRTSGFIWRCSTTAWNEINFCFFADQAFIHILWQAIRWKYAVNMTRMSVSPADSDTGCHSSNKVKNWSCARFFMASFHALNIHSSVWRLFPFCIAPPSYCNNYLVAGACSISCLRTEQGPPCCLHEPWSSPTYRKWHIPTAYRSPDGNCFLPPFPGTTLDGILEVPVKHDINPPKLCITLENSFNKCL